MRYVRVTDVRRDQFVEFQFSYGDPDLTIELVLPLLAFREFSTHNKTVILPAEANIQQALDRLEQVQSGEAAP